MSENLLDQLESEIPALRRFARALVGQPERADDLVQDTLERALKHLGTFRPGTNLRAWLFTILRNSNINEVRRARMTPASPDVIEALLPPVAASQEYGIVVRDLHRALGALSAEMREVVLLVGLEGLSYDETAAVLGVKVGTVKSRLCRGREALRRLLDGPPAPERQEQVPQMQQGCRRPNGEHATAIVTFPRRAPWWAATTRLTTPPATGPTRGKRLV